MKNRGWKIVILVLCIIICILLYINFKNRNTSYLYVGEIDKIEDNVDDLDYYKNIINSARKKYNNNDVVGILFTVENHIAYEVYEEYRNQGIATDALKQITGKIDRPILEIKCDNIIN